MFLIIGGTWLVGMAGYVLLGGTSLRKTRRCNVKQEVIKFKTINNQINAATKSKSRR